MSWGRLYVATFIVGAVVFFGGVASGVYYSFRNYGSLPRVDIGDDLQGDFRRLLDEGQHDAAIEQMELLLRIQDPSILQDEHEIRAVLGDLMLDRGNFDGAIAHYLRTIELRPGFPAIHNNLGVAYLNKNDPVRAREAFEGELRINPTHDYACNNLGLIYERQGKIVEASAYFQRAVQNNPDMFEGHFNLGNMMLKQDRLDGAIHHFERALELKPYFAPAHNNLGIAYERQGRLQDAIDHFKVALQLSPGMNSARDNLDRTMRALSGE